MHLIILRNFVSYVCTIVYMTTTLKRSHEEIYDIVFIVYNYDHVTHREPLIQLAIPYVELKFSVSQCNQPEVLLGWLLL